MLAYLVYIELIFVCWRENTFPLRDAVMQLPSSIFSFSQHIRMLSGLDTAWVTNSNNGLHAHGHPSWRNVQLETAKLLELGCVLPATILPHFQMYRWAFVGSQHDYCSSDIVNGHENDAQPMSKFIPHVTRIAQLMDFRYTSHSPVSLIYEMLR